MRKHNLELRTLYTVPLHFLASVAKIVRVRVMCLTNRKATHWSREKTFIQFVHVTLLSTLRLTPKTASIRSNSRSVT